MDPILQQNLNDTIRALYQVSDTAKRESRQAFKIASGILIGAIQARAPVSTEPHHRYDGGRIVATYYPGNLRRSFKTLLFRRSSAVFVGPVVDKAGSGGEFRGVKSDAYYAPWIEFGAPGAGIAPHPFVKPAVQAAGDLTLRIATDLLKRKIEQHARI